MPKLGKRWRMQDLTATHLELGTHGITRPKFSLAQVLLSPSSDADHDEADLLIAVRLREHSEYMTSNKTRLTRTFAASATKSSAIASSPSFFCRRV